MTTERHRPDRWPADFPLVDGSRIPAGLVVRSLSGAMEGRTTGLRRRCPATSEHCPGWLIGIVWEDGQELHICSEGWTYDPATREIRVTAGGEISARFTDRKGPLPREQWSTREALLTRPGWSSDTTA
jgi:hypothetical protein